MRARPCWRWLTLVIVVAVMLGIKASLSNAEQPAVPAHAESHKPPQQEAPDATKKGAQAIPPTRPLISRAELLSKLHPDLRELAQGASPGLPEGVGPLAADKQEPIMVEVIARVGPEKPGKREDLDLSPYFVEGKVLARPPFGKGELKMQVLIGFAYPSNLLKIASLHQVQAILPVVLERNAEPMPYPPDEERRLPKKGPEDWARLRANADKRREGSLPWDQAKAFGDGRKTIRPQDWFEVMPQGPHKAQAAWQRGYRGEGVTVAVLDDGIDAAHADLMGTQKIYSSAVAPRYNGWPMVFSPISMLLYAIDEVYGTTYIADGFPGLHYVDTDATPSLSLCGTGISCFRYRPLIDYGVPGVWHTYVISNTMTKSGVVHVGTHPDNDLRDWVWGEKVAVLVADPHVARVYDTVYVDLDDDYDFRDDKPLTKADVNDPSTYNSMIAYRDLNGDGITDISGGMLYFIADGNNVLPVSDWMWGASCIPGWEFMCPGNGDVVAFSGGSFDQSYSHGTACASNVVGQGMVNGLLPAFRNLPGDGKPTGAVFGMAPEAKVVNVSDIYWNFASSKIDAYMFSTIGYDAIDQTGWHLIYGPGYVDTDALQVTSNSYGSTDQDNDGWDYDGQVISELQRWWAPYLQFLFSTGNGAPAYGTVAPPSPATGIGVGASTQFGSTGWDSITETTQIMFNDVTPFSNRGPGARGTNGVDVVAGGAFAAGDQELNYYSISTWGTLDGNLAWDSWGGTSRSAPVAMGVLALIYQAYKDVKGVWPTYDEAKALLMSTATDLNYDTFTQGAGSVNADRGTAVAGGHYGLYVEGSEPTWQPGDYRGVDYPAFAHIAYPGDTFGKTFTIRNTGPVTITASVNDVELRLINTTEFTFTVTPEMVAAESTYGVENRDNFFKAFNYFIPLTATAGMNNSWYNVAIPSDTDLMIVRQMFPFDQFEIDGHYACTPDDPCDNRFYLMVYNWQDINDDGDVWEDKDENGTVNFINSGVVSQIDGAQELDWDDPRTELDRWEFGRFSYHRPGSNRNEMWVRDPLGRMIDGLFIGLRHPPDSTYALTTTLRYRIDFYREEKAPWLTESTPSLELPPGASATFVATATVPADMPPGMYEAAIQIQDPGNPPTYTADTAVIPVALSVATVFSDGLQLGGYEAYDYDRERPYNNAAVRGLFDWTWRAESGDWRFFFVDAENCTRTPVFEESFEAWPPAGWTVRETIGSCDWESTATTGATNRTGGSGGAAVADSDWCGTGMDAQLWTLALDFSEASSPILTFQTYFNSFLDYDDAYVDISTDGGTSWTNRLHYDGVDVGPFHEESIDLAAYAGQPNVIIRFRYVAPDWDWYWQVDDVTVWDMVCPYLSGTKFLIRDEWADAAPHTDLDTIVLGPTPSPLSEVIFGVWEGDFSEPSFFGPYVLDTVAKSPNTYMGDGRWRFDTSSGGNEDWVVAPFADWRTDRDGLHELLQHNVLFEGDKFDVVFTKTVGTLREIPRAFDIDAYMDQGRVGVITLTASLPLNGLVADGYGLGGPERFMNEPISFINSNTIEWAHLFYVNHGAKIELWTSSPDISDIDLYLYYCGPTGIGPCELRASSTTGTANEYVQVSKPEDGAWLVGIDNWSGPAGHFNLTKVVVQGYDLSVTGLPTGTIAANTPVTFTVSFRRSMTPGESYDGLLLVGPPEAPALKEIPITINRRAAVEKSVNHEVSFPDSELEYTISVYNSDLAAYWELTDPIPAGAEFLTVTNGTYDPVLDRVVYTGTFPLGYSTITLTVRITDTVAPGSWITNTATVTALSLFTGIQSASAATRIGAEEFATSYKEATTQVTAGDIISYEVHVINSGDKLAYVTLTDTIPVSTTFVSLNSFGPYHRFTYNSALNQVEWAGNVAPGEEWVFSFHVGADADTSWMTMTNTATIAWDGNRMDLQATTEILPPYKIFLLLIRKNFTP